MNETNPCGLLVTVLKFLFVVAVLPLLIGPVTAQRVFYVAPTGNDKNPGTLSQPFASPERAREAVRTARQNRPQSCTVVLRGGVYTRSATLTLTKEDGGTVDYPVVWQAYANEKVIWHGGRRLAGKQFQPVSDPAVRNRLLPDVRANVQEYDLRSTGLRDFPELVQHGFGTPVGPSPPELFIDGKPLTLARWPNDDIIPIGRVLDPGSAPRWGDRTNRGGTFGYEIDRPKRWTQARDLWLQGRFSFGYADDNLRVERIDTTARTIKVAQPHIYGIFSSLYIDSTDWRQREGQHLRGFFAYNLLEEIDQPGEWYLDRQTGKLYVYADKPLQSAQVELSLLDQPLIHMQGLSHFRLEGLSLVCSRGMGIYLEDVADVRINGATFQNLGTVAVSMGDPLAGGQRTYNADGSPSTVQTRSSAFRNVWIENCLISLTGTGGVIVRGGDRKTLTPASNGVRNCEFYQFNRINTTYSPAIALSGVGNFIEHCYLHDATHEAITYAGNDHRIEYNHLQRVCRDTDDMGAVYTGRDPASRGTVIRYNLFDSITHPNPESKMCAVYVDDGSGGIQITNNLFYRCGSPGKRGTFGAIFFHSGHDNVVRENVFVECSLAAGHVRWSDARWKEFITSDLMQKRLRTNVDILSDTYQTRYPELRGFLDTTRVQPRLNTFERNLVVRGRAVVSGNFIGTNTNVVTNSGLPGLTASDVKSGNAAAQAIPTLLPSFKLDELRRAGLQEAEFRRWHPGPAWR